MYRLTIFVVSLLLLVGCSTVVEKESSAQVEVNKGAPVVYIHPSDSDTYRHATVGVLPFLLPEGVDPAVGRGIGELYKDVLLGRQVFPRVQLIEDGYGSYEDAIAAGRGSGTDLVLAGRVNYFLEGTELGGTKLDVSIRLINVGSGATVWYIGQTMSQPMDYRRTDMFHFLISSTFIEPIKRPSGAPVLTNMFAQSAVDVADVLSGSAYVTR